MTTTIHCSPSRPALRLPDLSPHSRRREFAILQHFFFFSSFLPSFSFYFSFLLFYLSFLDILVSQYLYFRLYRYDWVSILLTIVVIFTIFTGKSWIWDVKKWYDSSLRERGLPYPRVGPISYYIQHRGKPSRQKPPMYMSERALSHISREREGKKSRKELTTDYEFEHHRPWFVGHRLPCNIDLCLLWFSIYFSPISRLLFQNPFSSLYKRIFFRLFPFEFSIHIVIHFTLSQILRTVISRLLYVRVIFAIKR